MLYDVRNPTLAPQIFYSGMGDRRPHEVPPGGILEGVDINPQIAVQLRTKSPLIMVPSAAEKPKPNIDPAKQPVVIIGMWGIGDNLHQRAVLRELMKTRDVWLETCHAELYHDLIAQGLKLIRRTVNLRAQAKTIEREAHLFNSHQPVGAPPKIKLWYHKAEIDECGSIAEAMFKPFGLRSTAPDFSMPVKPEWTEAARKLIDEWKPTKPLMVFRPIVQRREWDGAARNPDPAAYQDIFNSIRDRYFVASIADLKPGEEWIVGPELDADVKLHGGELDFPTLAGLWKEADLFFGNAGFGPVLAQAVGTPLIVVYGGRESYRTTERAGAHLAPTLGIDPINPCDCHAHHHRCDKRIDVAAAVARVRSFLDEIAGYERPAPKEAEPLLLNFGCGDNRLRGWRNMDIEVNIEQPLPFDSASADAVFSEHCVEHTSQYKAIEFFKEAHRVLKPGGLVRITVPSLEQVIEHSGADYWRFTTKWQDKGPTLEGAMHALVYAHGHQTVWTATALRACLFLAGFRDLTQQRPGVSDYALLRGVEGHGKVIGDQFNGIESLTFEGRKPGSVLNFSSSNEVEKAAPPAATKIEKSAALSTDTADRVLIFATTYVESPERQELTRQWLDLHTTINPQADFLLVDSASPLPLLVGEWTGKSFETFNFGDNIGHLSRGGRDGWGRAFCKGLDYAVERDYRYVVHIEGDSLLRVPVQRLLAVMRDTNKPAASIPVLGTTRPVTGWVETGLMAFNCEWLKRSRFTAQYDWPHRQVAPTPELVIARLLNGVVAMLPLNGTRNDNDAISRDTVVAQGWDWITHFHRDVWAYKAFVEAYKPRPKPDAAEGSRQEPVGGDLAPVATMEPLRLAVVVGGAESVWNELAATEELIAGRAGEVRYFVINDAIPLFKGPCTAVSLHPPKLKDWLAQREAAGLSAPDEVWAHVKHAAYPAVTHARDDWRGSSGLFSIAVARQLGFDRIVLCGVPMEANVGHITRGGARWTARDQFLGGWKVHKNEIAPYVRSWSGWTEETFGRPDNEFLGVTP